MSGGVYLASAIDQAAGPHPHYELLRQWLRGSGADWVFDPATAFHVKPGARRTPSIRRINTEALDAADVLVAVLPRGVISVGVPMEIQRAVAAGKPTLVISDAPAWMLQFGEDHVQVHDSPSVHALGWLDGLLGERADSRGGPEAREVVSGSRGDTGVGVLMPSVLEHPGAVLPSRGYPDDAGFDLAVCESVVIPAGGQLDVECGVRVALPPGSWGLIAGRSSTMRKRGLSVTLGVIDTGYRGPLFTHVWNPTDYDVRVEAGERLAQLILLPNVTQGVTPTLVGAGDLPPSERGEAGFGSTGV